MGGQDVVEKAVLGGHWIGGQDRQHVAVVVDLGEIIGQPGEEHYGIGVGLPGSQIADLEQASIIRQGRVPENVEVRLVPHLPMGDADADRPAVSLGQFAAGLVAIDGRPDEDGPFIVGVGRLAHAGRVAAVGEDRLEEALRRGPLGRIQAELFRSRARRAAQTPVGRVEARRAQQDGVELQAMGHVILNGGVLRGPVERAGALLHVEPVDRPAVPARAGRQAVLVLLGDGFSRAAATGGAVFGRTDEYDAICRVRAGCEAWLFLRAT